MKWSNIPKYIIHTYIYDNYTAVYVRVCVYKYFVFLYTKFKNCRRKEHSDANKHEYTWELYAYLLVYSFYVRVCVTAPTKNSYWMQLKWYRYIVRYSKFEIDSIWFKFVKMNSV